MSGWSHQERTSWINFGGDWINVSQIESIDKTKLAREAATSVRMISGRSHQKLGDHGKELMDLIAGREDQS